MGLCGVEGIQNNQGWLQVLDSYRSSYGVACTLGVKAGKCSKFHNARVRIRSIVHFNSNESNR
jgi:hypothetical protein